MRLPDTQRARRIRAGVLTARRARADILSNVEPPQYPRPWLAEGSEADWAGYDRSVRSRAVHHAPVHVLTNHAYWRTLATLFYGEALDKEHRIYVVPAAGRRARRREARHDRQVRHG